MKTLNNRFENKYVISCLALLTTCALFFQNCSPLKSQNTNSGLDLEIKELSEKSAKMTLSQHSGTVNPEYQYTITYNIEVVSKNFKLSVNKGASATGLPTPVDKTITDSQIAQIKNLVSKIKAGSCASGDMLTGGITESLGLFSSLNRTSPETVIYSTDCTGLSSSFYQAKSGFAELITFLKTL